LRQVELVVEECAFGELARLGYASAELETASQQLLHDDGPAMAMQLYHVFAGIRMRRGKIQRKALIDEPA
jgi:hypothetical protein